MIKMAILARMVGNKPFHEEAMPVGTFNEVASR
jgi:hypothetical protein